MDVEELEALHRPEGSEDLIIPDSENEEEAQENMGKNVAAGSNRALDLSRFLFA
jgi:hypothetical protein